MTADELAAWAATPDEKPTTTPSSPDALAAWASAPDEPSTAPQPVVADDGSVFVKDDLTGTIGTVSTDRLDALGGGVRLATADEIQADIDREEYGDVGSQVAAGAEGVAQGLTLGAYGLAAGAISPEYKRELELREQYNPVTSGIGQVVGAAAPVVLSGGTGALAKGAAYAPTALIERAGAAAGAKVAAKLGGGVAARIAGTAAAGAVEGGLESTALATTKVLPEALQDPGRAAEYIAAQGLQGLVIGGALGGTLGAVGEGLGAAARKLDGVATRRVEEAAKRATPELPAAKVDESNFAKIDAELRLEPTTSLEKLANDARSPQQARDDAFRAMQTAGDSVEETLKKNVPELNQALDDVSWIDSEAGVQGKLDVIAKRHKIELTPELQRDVFDQLDAVNWDLTQFAARMGSKIDYQGGGAALQRIEARIKDARRQMNAAIEDGNFRKFYGELDDVKRTIQKVANGTKSPEVREHLRRLDGGAEAFRKFLEDEKVWGEVGKFQKAWNAPVAERIRRHTDSRTNGLLIAESGDQSAVDLFEKADRVDSKWFAGFLERVGTSQRFADEEQAVRLWLRSMASDASNRAVMTGDKGLVDRAVRVVRAVRNLEDTIDVQARMNADAAVGRQLLERTPAEQIAAQVPFVGRFVGMIDMARQARAAAVAESVKGAESKVSQLATKLVKGAAKAAKAGVEGARIARQVAVPAAAVLSQRKFDGAVEEAVQLRDPNSPAYAELTSRHAELADVDPSLAEAYAQSVLNRADFIASKLPVQKSTALFAPKPALDPGSERKLRRYVAASYAPAAALDRLASGIGSPEDVETVKTLYPRMYEDFVRQTEEQLRGLKQPPPADVRRWIHMATGLEVDPTMNPKSVALYQQVAQGAGGESKQQTQVAQPATWRGARDPNQVYGSRVDSIVDR